MLLLSFFPPNFVEPRDNYSVTAIHGGYLFMAKSTDFQDLPRFEVEQDQNILM